MNKKVSVIIPNWNGQKFLKVCFDSLQKQTFQNFEIILVDNGSIDDSVKFTKKNYPKVKILKLDKNYGFSKAVNIGIKSSKSEFVALLNNDVKVDRNWLENLVQTLGLNKNYSFAASKLVLYSNPKIIDAAGIGYTFWGLPYQIGNQKIDQEKYNQAREIFGACAGAALYKREIFQKIGYFDEDFFAYYEDVDLSFRAQLAGFKCIYVPTSRVLHVHSGTSKNKAELSKIKNIPKISNALFVIVKNVPSRLIWKNIFKIIFVQLKIWFYFIKIKKPQYIFQSYWRFFQFLGKKLRERKIIQKQIKVDNEYLLKIIDQHLPSDSKVVKLFQYMSRS